jgi:hypothetical protein
MSCDRTNHDQPFWLLDTILIPLGIAQCFDLDVPGLLDVLGGSVSDKDWLASPFYNDLYPVNIPIRLQCRISHTFLPSGIEDKSTSTLAIAKTSAEADMLTKKSGFTLASANHSNYIIPSIEAMSA